MRKPLKLSIIPIICLVCGAVAHSAEHAETRTISVTGTGELSVEPDRAIVNLGVEESAPKLDVARDGVNTTVAAVLEICEDLGIEKERVKTTRLSVRPQYKDGKLLSTNRAHYVVGYFVTRSIVVELTDVEDFGHLIERALEAGVNQVFDPVFDSSRKTELQLEALERAAADARRNAEVLAKTLGARVGPPRTLNAFNQGFRPPVPGYRMAARSVEAFSAEETYSAGEIRITAQVNAEFDLIVTGD